MNNHCLVAADGSTTATKIMPMRENLYETEKQHDQNMSLFITNLSGESDEHLAQMITSFAQSLSHKEKRCLGYPSNLEFDYEALAPLLLHCHINNAGDPFVGSSYTLNSAAIEVCILEWFASLWEIDENKYWGYVTTGGTEGNLHGILLGREQLPDGILYASEESHYSVVKIARMYRVQCVKVATLRSGEIDCFDLKASLLAHKDKPAIINLNIGTTMKGAIDDIDLVVQTLEECGFSRDRFYIHCDGALFGPMLPFIKQAPKLSFKKPIGSIAISGHKFIGCPVPCGVLITRLDYINAMSRDVEIIASRDTTITGSRNGHAPIFLWYAIKKKGLLGLKNEVDKCMRNAHYLQHKLLEAGIKGVTKNEFSNIVVFEKPQDNEFCRRWSLACNGDTAHVVVMQHVSVEMLDSFVSEFVQNQSLLVATV